MVQTKQVSKTSNNTDEKQLISDLEKFRETAKAWNEEFDMKLPEGLRIIKGKDTTDKNGNITKYGKLMINIKFDNQRKGFFISNEVIADKLINFIENNKSLLLKLSQLTDLINDVSDTVKKNGKPKEYKIL